MPNNDKKENKVYGMLLEIGDTLFLTIQYASSLEDAFNQAKLEFNRLNPKTLDIEIALLNAKIGLFGIKTINEMLHENKVYNSKQLEKIIMKHRKVEQKEIIEEKKSKEKKPEVNKIKLTKEEVKNMIMKEIISRKDKIMFESHKELFNENEIKYLTEKIKGKQKI